MNNPALSRYSDEERELLVFSPFAVAKLVAGADGTFDRKEREAFIDLLGNYCGKPDSLTAGVVTELLKACQSGQIVGLAEKHDSFFSIVKISRLVATTCSPEDANAFFGDLLEIGQHVAEASGGVLGVFGSRVSDKEVKVLRLVATTSKLVKGTSLSKTRLERRNSWMPLTVSPFDYHDLLVSRKILRI